MLKTSKTSSTRVQLPLAPSGTEPTNAAVGTLSFADDTDVVRVQTSVGWAAVGGSGGGSVSLVTSSDGSVVITNPSGPTVGLSVTESSIGGPFVKEDFSGYTSGTPAAGSDIVFNVAGSPGTVRVCNLGDLVIAGNVTGTLSDVDVVAITESSGPTTLSIGSISDGQLLQRSTTTVAGATPNATLVGLGNVDNVKQLAYDITTYTYDGSPLTTDRLYKVAADGTHTRTLISDVLALTPTASTLVTSPYMKAPASPNAYNFEASTASTADLATLGFTFRRATATAGTMTRVGDIYAARGIGSFTALTTYQYRSSLINGFLYIQLPTGTSDIYYTLTKSVSVPTTSTTYGAFLWARFVQASGYVSSGFNNLVSLAMFKDSGGNADITNYIEIGSFVTTGYIRRVGHTVSGSGTVTDNNMGLPISNMEDIKTLSVYATTTNLTYYAAFVSAYTPSYGYYTGGGPALGVASNMTHAGFLFRPGTSGSTTSPYTPFDYCIEFARFHTGDLSGQWIGGL